MIDSSMWKSPGFSPSAQIGCPSVRRLAEMASSGRTSVEDVLSVVAGSRR